MFGCALRLVPAAATLVALRAHLEAVDCDPLRGFLRGAWKPLLLAAKLPYRKPHAMRHSYATWMLEAGDRGTYGHLERERHEDRVNLDTVLGGVHSRPPASTLSDADG